MVRMLPPPALLTRIAQQLLLDGILLVVRTGSMNMKPSRKTLNSLLIVWVVLFTIGCMCVTPAVTEPSGLPSAASPNQGPTAAAPQTLSPADGPVVSALTDASGQAVFTDPVNPGIEVTITVQDQATRQPLMGVNLWLKSSGQEILVVAMDGSGTYVAAVQEYRYADLTREAGGGRLAALAPAPRQVPVAILIVLIKAAMMYEDISTYYAALSDLPEISRWSFQQNEFCMANPNKEQLDQYASAIISAIPLPDFLADKIMLRPVKELLSRFIEERLILLMKDAIAENISEVLETQVGQRIKSQPPAIIHFKIFSITGGIPDILVPDGFCLEPLKQTQHSSVLQWAQYGVTYKNLYALASISEDGEPDGQILYANAMEGGSPRTQAEFLQDLQARFTGQPVCAGVSLDGNTAFVWVENWSPAWQLNEMCYDGCYALDPPHISTAAAFVLKKLNNTWYLKGVYMQNWKNAADSIVPCDSLP